ncbi:MAG: hypothetical protein IPF39_17830 [Comamonadaceae bacterium]|uniref:hypothetical protein n=1 Tax=Candidatus Skiveiella danica TaxID=3386177 RepID=UPI00390C1542|nr:hypothetical protein [Comamonadaceae bacterium]
MLIGTIALARGAAGMDSFCPEADPRKCAINRRDHNAPAIQGTALSPPHFPMPQCWRKDRFAVWSVRRSAARSDAAKKALQALDGLAVDFVIAMMVASPLTAFDLDAPGSKSCPKMRVAMQPIRMAF